MDIPNIETVPTDTEEGSPFTGDREPHDISLKSNSMDVGDVREHPLPSEPMSVGPAGDFKIPFSSASSLSLKGDLTRDEHMYQPSTSTAVGYDEKPLANTDQGNITLSSILKDASNEMKSGCLQWTQIFQESEEFENFCPTRVDKLLAEAKALEENLLEQKEQLMQRLKALSQTLQAL